MGHIEARQQVAVGRGLAPGACSFMALRAACDSPGMASLAPGDEHAPTLVDAASQSLQVMP